MANYVEKENVFIRIVKYLFPCKGDKAIEVVRKIIFLSAAIVLITTLTIILTTKLGQMSDNKKNEQLADMFHSAESAVTGNTGTNVEIDTGAGNTTSGDDKNTAPVKHEILENFNSLLEMNDETIGWLKIPGMYYVDLPVMQTTDNDYYLNHSFERAESRSGALYADYHVPIKADSRPANIVIYGHNMATGEYFGTLPDYFNWANSHPDHEDISFYKEHPTLEFSTLWDTSTYKIFAGIMTNTQEEAGEVFPYHMVHNFKSKSDFDSFCANVLDRSCFINPDIDLTYGDELITLSTCMLGGYGESADPRFVIFARKVREGEDPNVDVSRAFSNPSPLFYDLYYEIYGGQWEGRKWPTDIIQGFAG